MSKSKAAALSSSITKHGLSMLLEILGLDHSVSKTPTANHAIIVAIDFEGTDAIRKGFALTENCQVGFAILDTEVLRQPEVASVSEAASAVPEIASAVPEVASAKLVSTSNFAAGTPSYIAEASKRFLFGDTVTIRAQASSLIHAIQLHIPQDRNVVLIGYDIINELEALRNLGYELKQPLGILDIYRIANEVLGFWGGSLSDLLIKLDCPFPFKKLHTAGNDAHFTLRALLLLAARWCISQGQEDEILDILLDFSYSPIPSVMKFEKQAIKKPAVDRATKSRKKQLRSWSKEKQDSIRAARDRQRLQHAEEKEGDYMLELLLEPN